MSEQEKEQDNNTLSWREKMAIEEHEKLSPRLVYEIIRKNGIEELKRPAKALIFSGITAGIVISFSFIFKAILNAYLPDTGWSFLVENMGYTVGFVLVILGHMQLFTENTIATVVPLFHPFTLGKLKGIARLWSIVFISNLIGTALAALFLLNSQLFDAQIVHALDQLAEHVASFSVTENIIKGIPAGILIASLVWILPSATSNKFFLIFFITYLMSLGGFTHVIVGSAEMAYWVFKGHANGLDYLFQFLLPTTLGNIIGGTGIFTLLIYGQINEELE